MSETKTKTLDDIASEAARRHVAELTSIRGANGIDLSYHLRDVIKTLAEERMRELWKSELRDQFDAALRARVADGDVLKIVMEEVVQQQLRTIAHGVSKLLSGG